MHTKEKVKRAIDKHFKDVTPTEFKERLMRANPGLREAAPGGSSERAPRKKSKGR